MLATTQGPATGGEHLPVVEMLGAGLRRARAAVGPKGGAGNGLEAAASGPWATSPPVAWPPATMAAMAAGGSGFGNCSVGEGAIH